MILTVTFNPAVDHTVQVESLPKPETVARTDTARFDAGGKGINVSQYLTTLGIDTVATGLAGDFLGDYIEQQLRDDGIDHELIEIDGQTRLNTTIVGDDAEYKINHTGPTVEPQIVDAVIEVIADHEPSMVLVAGSLPPGLDSRAIDRIANAGPWETVVDLGGDLLRSLAAEYALCKPNRTELADATGLTVESLADCVRAAQQLRKMGFDRVVTSLGSDGALLVSETEVLHAAALDVEVADTVGAGDAMLSGVLSELVHGNGPRAGLKRGVAVASLMVSVSGTKMPTPDGLDAETEQVTITDYPTES